MQKVKFLYPLSRCLHRNGSAYRHGRTFSALPSYAQHDYLQEEEASFWILSCIYIMCLSCMFDFYEMVEMLRGELYTLTGNFLTRKRWRNSSQSCVYLFVNVWKEFVIDFTI